MPLVVCYEIHLQRDRNRPIFLTRVRDASNALNIAQYQVKILNESWLHKVEWTANVIETLCDEDKLEADDPVHELKQGDVINEQVQRPLAGGTNAGERSARQIPILDWEAGFTSFDSNIKLPD